MTDVAAELRMLRARAYGPDADIADDPAALARLAELEAAFAAAPRAAAADAVEPPPAAASEPLPAEPSSDGSPSDGMPEPAPAAEPAPRRRPRWLVPVWAASVIVALVLGAVAATTTFRAVTRDPGADLVETLQEDPAFTLSGMFGDGVGLVGFQDFFGFTAVIAPYGMWGGESADGCLVVVRTASVATAEQGIDGPLYSDCPAPPFPAAVQIPVDDAAPSALRERFGDGTALQFVYDGESVGVFLAG